MLNGSKATEASARSSCRELLVCSSEAGSAGKQLPILPLLQNNYLCELNLVIVFPVHYKSGSYELLPKHIQPIHL
jgi:hypothetical protein